MAEEEDVTDIFKADTDQFKGVVLKPHHYGLVTADEFERKLKDSLTVWGSEGKRGVWIKIPLEQSELIAPAARVDSGQSAQVVDAKQTRPSPAYERVFSLQCCHMKLGLQYHHAHSDHVMMTKWLPTTEPNNLPNFANHYIGVAGFVVNAKGEVLLVQEKWIRRLSYKHWKLPGGHTEKGEELWETAIRETWEETGVRSEFVSMLCFRHMHDYRWGTDDIYFACLLRPLNTDIMVHPAEIAEAKWMDVDAYIADPETTTTNRLIAQSYKDGLENGLFIQPTSFPHFLSDRKDLVLYRNQPWKGEGESETRPEPHTKL